MAALLVMWLLPLGAYVAYVILANRKKRGVARLEEVLDAPGEQDFYTAVGELMMERVESLGFFQRYLPERKVEPNFQNSYGYWHNQYLPAQRQL